MTNFLPLLQFCFLTAALAVFVDFCLQKGNIFYPYYRLIEKLPLWLFKPLGGCCHCFGTWLFIVFFVASQPWNFLSLVFGCGLQYIFITLFFRYAY